MPAKILMSLLSCTDNLFHDNHIIFQKNADNFAIEQKTKQNKTKTYLISIWGAVPLENIQIHFLCSSIKTSKC